MIYVEDEKKHVVYEYNVSRNVELKTGAQSPSSTK